MKNKRWWAYGYLLALFILVMILHTPRVFIPFGDQLVTQNNRIRMLASIRLAKMKPEKRERYIPELLIHTSNENSFSRRIAFFLLRKLKSEDPVFKKAVVAGLRDESGRVREEAAISVMGYGPQIIPDLMEELPSLDLKTRASLTRFIVWKGEEMVPALHVSLSNPRPEVQKEVIMLLGDLRTSSLAVKPDLLPFLSSSNKDLRFQAALAINKIDPAEKETLPVHKEILEEAEWGENQFESLVLLRGLGKKAKPLWDLLLREFYSRGDGYKEGPYPKPEIIQTLMAIKSRSATTEGLMWDLKQKKAYIRYRASFEIGQLDPANRSFAPNLIPVVRDEDRFVSVRSIFAITEINAKNTKRFHQELIPDLIRAYQLAEKEGESPIEGDQEVILLALSQTGRNAIPFIMDQVQKKELPAASAIKILQTLSEAEKGPLDAYASYDSKEVKAVFQGLSQSEE